MSQIYVVCKQIKNQMGIPTLCPDQAFQDYPSAIAYAEKIFMRDMFNPAVNPRDLVYLLNVTAAPVMTIATTSTPVPTPTPA